MRDTVPGSADHGGDPGSISGTNADLVYSPRLTKNREYIIFIKVIVKPSLCLVKLLSYYQGRDFVITTLKRPQKRVVGFDTQIARFFFANAGRIKIFYIYLPMYTIESIAIVKNFICFQ